MSSGYDTETGLIQTYKGEALSIPDNPIFNDVKTALSRLRHAFVDFPFEHEMYWSGFLAGALSLLARYAWTMGRRRCSLWTPTFAARARECWSTASDASSL